MPKTVTNVNLNPSGMLLCISPRAIVCIHVNSLNTSAGVANYDPVNRVVNWNVSTWYSNSVDVFYVPYCRLEKLPHRNSLRLLEV